MFARGVGEQGMVVGVDVRMVFWIWVCTFRKGRKMVRLGRRGQSQVRSPGRWTRRSR